MKSTIFTLLALGLLAVATMQITATGSDSAPASKKLRHMVMFGFKDSSSEADVQAVVDAFVNLPRQIPSIKAFEHGTNNSPEGLNDGLTHCFLITFDDEAGRAEYLPHPAHKAFGKMLKPHLEKVVVVDYWAE